MDITGSAPPSQSILLTSAPAAAELWLVGQRLNAVVVALLSPDRVSLRIGDSMVEARASLSAVPGQKLTLEVTRADRPITLRLVADIPTADPIKMAIRAALPAQLPLQTALTRIAEVFASSSALTPTVTALLKQLLQQLPGEHAVGRADSLKQSLMDSGLFLEHKLHTNAPAAQLNSDIKANLLRLLAGLAQGQGDDAAELTRHGESAVARIQLHQLAALAQALPATVWAGELPIRHGNHIDVLQYRIDKDGEDPNTADPPSWCTWLSLNLKTLGPLHAKITLSERHIAAAFWAESDSTVDLINENADYLRESIERAGLGVKGIYCRQGQPPFPPPDRLPKGLLDLTA